MHQPAHRGAPQPAAADRTRALTAAVRARLGPVCAGWPDARFAALVRNVVRFHERWDARDGRAWRA